MTCIYVRETPQVHSQHELMTTVAGPPVMPAIDPAAAIPVADWGGLVLRAGRFGPILPHIAWLLRFADVVPAGALEEEARRLAATPYGFGRRVAPARLPAGRAQALSGRGSIGAARTAIRRKTPIRAITM